MRHRRFARRANTAVTAALALLATSAVAATPVASAQETTDSALVVAQDDAENKISGAALKQLESDKTAEFWIEFTGRADLSDAQDITDWGERGEYVVDTLTETAKSSQAGVIKKLDAAGVDYQTYWISNSIYVQDGSLDLATSIATAAAVDGIHEQFEMRQTEPVSTRPADTKLSAVVEWGLDEINAPDVWDQGYTGAGITVASFDTGVDLTHPALESNYRGYAANGAPDHDYNWFDFAGSCGGAPCDVQDHGTHTTGTMVGDDGSGNQVGVAPGATWIAGNCIDNGGCEFDDYLTTAQWFLNPTRVDGTDPDPAKRPHVINNSWGIPPGLDEVEFGWMRDEVLAWDAAGIFGAWAAGNEGSACETSRFPGSYENTYSVGAYDSSGTIASFSSRGPGENGVLTPNIAAPGVDIRSSVPGGGYAEFSGTSMATPHLAGAIALLWSAAPSLVGDIAGTKDVLDGTAIDTEDSQCGGTTEANFVWGEGKLDIAAGVAAAPTAGTGTIEGTVTDADDTPIAGAEILMDGTHDRTLVTDQNGTFSATVLIGDYDVSATAFGYLDSTPEPVTVVEDETITVPITLASAPRHSVAGVVNYSDGSPVVGAPVSLGGNFVDSTTDANGEFAFDDVPEGTYPLTVTLGGCATSYSDDVVVDGDVSVPVTVESRADEFGYTCAVSTSDYAQAETDSGLAGDDGAISLDLPFDFPFYGETRDTVHAATNGHLNFLQQSTAYSNSPIPDGSEPNAAIYPFWDDLYFVSGESALYEGATTVDGVDGYVLEYRDVARYSDRDARLDFSVTLLADGDIVVGYGELTGEESDGSSATTGIENSDGTVALQYSANTAALSEGLTVTYAAPALGTLSGRVRDDNTSDPVAGADVTLTDTNGVERTVETGEQGRYTTVVPLGTYDVDFTADGYEPVTKHVRFTEDGQDKRRNARLAAGLLTINKEEISATRKLGGATVTRGFRVTNDGTAAVDVEVGTTSGGFEMLSLGAGSAGVIHHVEGGATVPTAADSPGTSWGPRPAGTLGTSALAEGNSAFPEVSVPADATTLTHSDSQEIASLNSAACGSLAGTSANSYLRTFTLADFGIEGGFDVSEVSFGVEQATAQTLTVNLYRLAGDDLVYANLEKVGTVEQAIEAQTLSMVNVPVTGSVAGGTLVVEVVSPDQQDTGGLFYIGSNAAGQSAPSYLKADECDIPEPADTESIGWPDMHIVMNVSGTPDSGGSAGSAWLDVQPGTVSLEPGESVRAVATLDPRAVDQPGTYTANIVAAADTPYDEPSVTTTFVVNPPGTWGKVTGTVSDDASGALDGATVHIDGLEKDVTLLTGADGAYSYWMGVSNNSLEMIVAKDGYIPQSRSGTIIAGQTVTYDFGLTALP